MAAAEGEAADAGGGDDAGGHAQAERVGCVIEFASGVSVPAGLTLKEVEREYIRQSLDAFDGRVSATAESLGISRKNLWEKRKRHGLMD